MAANRLKSAALAAAVAGAAILAATPAIAQVSIATGVQAGELDGTVSNARVAVKAVQIAETDAPGKVVNLLSLGSSQQVMLEVRFAEVKRSALTQLGVSWGPNNTGNTQYVIGGGSSLTPVG